MIKLGIISSFNIMCGNATYTKAIIDGIQEYYDIEPIEIPVSLQKNHNSKNIKEIIEKLKSFDAVNLQLELSLYGPTPKLATALVQKMINTNRIKSITMHRVEEETPNIIKTIYQSYKIHGFKNLTDNLLMNYVKKNIYKSYKEIIITACKKKIVFIVHTNRERSRIARIRRDAKVFVHPILWPENIKSKNNIILKERFNNDNKVIGVFGFVSHYKNFLQVARVAKREDYNLVIAGSTHPTNQGYGKLNDKNNASWLVSNELYGKDTHYKGYYILTAPEDDIFLTLIENVDLVIIPYLETEQSGSGIASLAIQYGKRVIFSDTALITELNYFLNKKPFLFDVNSDASMVSAIKDALYFQSAYEIKFEGYSFSSNIKTYIDSLGINEVPI
ncbi:hypothetical protein [Endozoicomonas sp. SCSIO W0465]|uniref:hypothetical protein n=1 Tax=Endozoicomonas sp. SCSIO W0465 TaxID=2918516 RepID=UPI002074D580|nr:hypothetical protein [Endozoicomonas sp. SCSIO W0465]USE33905.1 hypothetical protein MJO57_17175 [Endozoicomonas sp. SCSIO W0465]